MNLQNKTEFKEFVKEKLKRGYVINIISTSSIINSPILLEVCEKSNGVNFVLGKYSNKSFTKYNKWLTVCEDETYTHFKNKCDALTACLVASTNKYKTSPVLAQVTCKRCLAEMENK